jgi:uncharacterized protein YmfQ (DUF2313 family)
MYGTSEYGLLKYAENIPSAEEIKKYFVDLTRYVPLFISDIHEMKAAYEVEGTELGSILYYLNDRVKQFFIDTATWGLTYWEDEYGIDTNLNASYEERREVLKAKKRGQGTTTKAMLKKTAEAFSGGEVNVIENNAEHSFVIQFVGIKGIPKNLQAFKNMVEDIKPAHLTYSFKYTYTVWNVLKQKNLNWNNCKVKTWDELKVYE